MKEERRKRMGGFSLFEIIIAGIILDGLLIVLILGFV